MPKQKETRPIRQDRERVAKSNHIVSQNSHALEGAILTALALFAFLAVPHLLYSYVAPMQGWIA